MTFTHSMSEWNTWKCMPSFRLWTIPDQICTLHWPNDWIIIFKHRLAAKMHVLCLNTELSRSCKWSAEDETLHLVRLRNHQHMHQNAQNILFLKNGFYFVWLYIFFSTIRTLKSTPQSKKCSHAHNSARTLQVLVTLFCPCLLFQTLLTSQHISSLHTFLTAPTHSTVFQRWL